MDTKEAIDKVKGDNDALGRCLEHWKVLWPNSPCVMEPELSTSHGLPVMFMGRREDSRVQQAGSMEGAMTRGLDFDVEADPPTIVVILKLDDCSSHPSSIIR